jgi:hypothetical protein
MLRVTSISPATSSGVGWCWVMAPASAPARCLSTNKTEKAVSFDARVSVNTAGGHMGSTPKFHLETATPLGRAPRGFDYRDSLSCQ